MRKQISILIFVTIWVTFFSCKGQQTDELVRNGARWTFLKDKERIDGYTRIGDSIYGGEIACDVKPLEDIDVSTFQVLPGTQYAKDKKHVYYPILIMCVDYEDCGVCYYSEYIVEKANPATFKYLGNDYGTDGKNRYFRGKIVEK
jgi:hypothetical protein